MKKLPRPRIKTKGVAGRRVEIVKRLDPFICSGNKVERVLVRNIDDNSPCYGLEFDVNLDYLEESQKGLIAKALKEIKNEMQES